MLTAKQGVTMDRRRFVRFMDEYLGMRNADMMDGLYRTRCRTGQQHMTGGEFVELLSLMLAGQIDDLVHLIFEVYMEVVGSTYLRKDDVLAMAERRNGSAGGRGGVGGGCAGRGGTPPTDYNQIYADQVMRALDKDRDDRISAEDYRKAVAEDLAHLQFLGLVLPERDRAEAFHVTFSARPYVNNVIHAWMEQLYPAVLASRDRTASEEVRVRDAAATGQRRPRAEGRGSGASSGSSSEVIFFS